MRIAASTLTLALALTACKQQPATEAETKDFAYSAAAKNYAVVVGFNPEDPDGVRTDVANWKNMLSRGQLGAFETVYVSDDATAAKTIEAFKVIGGSLSPDSTVVFVFAGRSAASNLRAKDRTFTFGEAADAMVTAARAAKRSGGRRLYVFNDATPLDAARRTGPNADRNRYAMLGTSKLLAAGPGFFRETFELGASSNDLPKTAATATYAGRFSYEFIKLLDKYVGADTASQANPRLQDFFLEVVKATSVSTLGAATYVVKPTSLLNESMFTAAMLKERQARVAAAAAAAASKPGPAPAAPVAPGATEAPFALSLPLTGASGASDIKTIFKGKAMLLEVSASWCGPCANYAGQLAEDVEVKQLAESGKCTHATLVPNDSDSNLDDWNNATGNAAVNHSFAFNGASQELESAFLAKLTGQPVSIRFFPTVFVINRAGEVISVGQDSALKDYKDACR